jgi:hypothetical protein
VEIEQPAETKLLPAMVYPVNSIYDTHQPYPTRFVRSEMSNDGMEFTKSVHRLLLEEFHDSVSLIIRHIESVSTSTFREKTQNGLFTPLGNRGRAAHFSIVWKYIMDNELVVRFWSISLVEWFHDTHDSDFSQELFPLYPNQSLISKRHSLV